MLEDEATFTLTLENPCSDASFISLNSITSLQQQQYTLYTDEMTLSHTLSPISLQYGDDTELCGEVGYIAKLNS